MLLPRPTAISAEKILWAVRLTDRPTFFTHVDYDDTLNLVLPADFRIMSFPNYTVNHKKRDILFLTITLANLSRFL